mgnify:CR=1 FL=1|jgi:hypothetical protein
MARTALVALVLAGLLVSAASAAKPAVTINYRQSSCLQRPLVGKGEVRFFVRFYNSSNREATFGQDIRFLWLRTDGWKDSWLNTIDGDSIKVPARRGKTYYADFGADPTKRILRCALRIGTSDRLHFVRVLR